MSRRGLVALHWALRASAVAWVALAAIRGDVFAFVLGIGLFVFDVATSAWMDRRTAERDAYFAKLTEEMEARRQELFDSMTPEERELYEARMAEAMDELWRPPTWRPWRRR